MIIKIQPELKDLFDALVLKGNVSYALRPLNRWRYN